MVVRTTTAHPLLPSLSWSDKRDGHGETCGRPVGDYLGEIRMQKAAHRRLPYSLCADFADVETYLDCAYAVRVATIP